MPSTSRLTGYVLVTVPAERGEAAVCGGWSAEEGANVFTTEMLGVIGGLREFDRLGDDFVVFVEPPSLDTRILNQFALFALVSSPTARALRPWMEHRRTGSRATDPCHGR